MKFLKLLHKFKVLILLLLLVIILVISIKKTTYAQFDEKSWYDEENISEKMLGVQNIDVDQLLRLKETLETINIEQEIHNKDAYIINITLVIVIQVHDRSFYLENLLQSLERVKGISKSMIVFSYDYFDNETFATVQNTYFTKYMQIFYPYSIQLHPRVFPGKDLKFCNKNLIDCEVNFKNRDPEKAQLKHRWWWTVSTVFDKLQATQNYDGNIVFLEEDQYVTEDLIFVVKLLEKMMPNIYPNWNMMGLGVRYPKIRDYHINDTRLDIEAWGLNENIAVVFNRTLWDKLKKLADVFCRFNDYSWSNSLIHLGKYTTQKSLIVASMKSSKVFRFENCENTENTYCHEVEKVINVQKFTKRLTKFLYPFTVSYSVYNQFRKPEINFLGGWSDVRDHELCMSYTRKIKF